MYATFVCTIHYCTDDATSHYLLLFPAKIVHTFFNMVLTEHAEEDEIAVPLCLMIIALATQHLNGPRIIQCLDSTKKCIKGSPYCT